jgi:MGT family glycosyltransferase
MARYLAYTSPARGHLYPIVPTLLELRRRGHEVHVRTLASEVEALQAEGLQAGAIAPAIEGAPLDDWKAATPQEGLARVLVTFADRAKREVPDLQRAIEQVDPDVLLVDITTVGAAAVAEAQSIPWAQSIPLFQHFSFGPEAPAELTFVPFAIDPMAGIEVLNAPRRQLGLAPLAGLDEVWRAPLHLYYTAKPFELEGLVLPPSFRLVGPGVWEPSVQTPEWLEEIGEPLVLVSASSELQRDEGLIEAALPAMRTDDVRVVVTTAAHDPRRFPAPAHARVTRWLPHGPVLQKAACVVCHGGMGITQKALAAGVPVCIVPFGRDQFEVAKRVTAAGAGTMIPPEVLNPGSLRAAIHQAILMRDGAQRIAAVFARAGGASAAAEALESLLVSPPEASQLRRSLDPSTAG